jgi:hypothetical protein
LDAVVGGKVLMGSILHEDYFYIFILQGFSTL